MKQTEDSAIISGLDNFDVAPVRHLVQQALDELHPGNPDIERAIWRLIDAAGMLSECFPDTWVGVKESTGRGYRLVRS